MTKQEYIKKMQEDEEWSPGWDAIDKQFDALYPGVKPYHYATNIECRAMFGGNEYLDGFSIYDTGKGYMHIVTYGMSELYADENAFGEEWSKWGYEMTLKLKAKTPDECLWAVNVLSNLARYTFQSEKYFTAGDFIPGNGQSLHIGVESQITGLVVIGDTSVDTIETLHGKVEFLQLFGITADEANALRNDYTNFDILINRIKEDNPECVINMGRTKSYL